jgi:hypothetical protein
MSANWFGGFLKIFAIGKNPCLIRVSRAFELLTTLFCLHLPIGRYKKAVHINVLL